MRGRCHILKKTMKGEGHEQAGHMPDNRDTRYAAEFHEETKHSEIKLRMSRHYLDWENRPRPFKVYLDDLPSIPLPRDFAVPAADALACIAAGSNTGQKSLPVPSTAAVLDTRTLAQLLFFSAGITREMSLDSGTYYMRAASATGALYPIELYVVCGGIDGEERLPAGVYHFSPAQFSLIQLRAGKDFRPQLAAMAGGNADVLSAPATVVFTSLAWRNAWKYGDRSYRHWFWDSGVIAANLLAVAAAAGLRSSLAMGFVDQQVNSLLRLEQEKEAAVALAPVGAPHRVAGGSDVAARPDPTPVAIDAAPRVLPTSRAEAEHPEIWKIHAASSLASTREVAEWLGDAAGAGGGARHQDGSHDREAAAAATAYEQKGAAPAGIGEVILRRGSTRRFSRSAISKAQLSAILHASTRGVPLDLLRGREDASLVDIYLIANAVEGLAPAHYSYNRQAGSLERLFATGSKENASATRNESGYLCLGQPLFSDASAVLFVMADLDAHLKALGNRGYRACQFEAGVVAGKVYLSSYALGLGASGSTFYDDAVTESFFPHAKNKAAMIAIGVGVPAYRARPGRVLAATLTKSQLLSDQ
jgi:SagB-type dehydrogenase family enzyme